MQSDYPLLITLGTLIVLAPILRSLLERIGVPALVGYIGLGFAVSAMDNLWSFIPPASESVFSAMAQLGIVALLFLAAVLGKFAGVAGPALLSLGRNDAILLGISMIPRAQIALVIMYQCLQFGEDIVPAQIFTGMVLVLLATCILSLIVLRHMLGGAPSRSSQRVLPVTCSSGCRLLPGSAYI